MICEACKKNEGVNVRSVPGVPMSAAYCGECLIRGNHPMNILIMNTAIMGGLGKAAGWWQEIVMKSLECQGKTLEWFNEQVIKDISTLHLTIRHRG